MKGMEMLLGAMGFDFEQLQNAIGPTVAAINTFDARLTALQVGQKEVAQRLMNVEAAVLKFELETKRIFSEVMNVNTGRVNGSGDASGSDRSNSASGSGDSASGSDRNDSGSERGSGSSGSGSTASGSVE